MLSFSNIGNSPSHQFQQDIILRNIINHNHSRKQKKDIIRWISCVSIHILFICCSIRRDIEWMGNMGNQRIQIWWIASIRWRSCCLRNHIFSSVSIRWICILEGGRIRWISILIDWWIYHIHNPCNNPYGSELSQNRHIRICELLPSNPCWSVVCRWNGMEWLDNSE